MQEINQKTLKDTITLQGVGLHNGKKVNLYLKPAEVDYGIKFKRLDGKGKYINMTFNAYFFGNLTFNLPVSILNLSIFLKRG